MAVPFFFILSPGLKQKASVVQAQCRRYGIKDHAEYKNKGLKRPDRRRTAEKVI